MSASWYRLESVAGAGEMRRRRTNRPRQAFSATTDAPRDLATRLAEVKALRQLVKLKEEELEQQKQGKKNGGLPKQPPARS